MCPTGSQSPGQHAPIPDGLLWQPPLQDPCLWLGERGRRGEGEAGESSALCSCGFPVGEEVQCQKKIKSNDKTVVVKLVFCGLDLAASSLLRYTLADLLQEKIH